MMTEGDIIDVDDLPEYLRERQEVDVSVGTQDGDVLSTLEEVERAHTLRALQSVGGNKVRAAELLGVSRAKLYRILGECDTPEGTTASGDRSESSD